MTLVLKFLYYFLLGRKRFVMNSLSTLETASC
jgi:hypothetical protein